jgi:hypothetical protein
VRSVCDECEMWGDGMIACRWRAMLSIVLVRAVYGRMWQVLVIGGVTGRNV